MVDVIALFGAAMAAARKVREVAEKTKDAELRGLIADLMLGMSDLKLRVSELQTENANLQSQLASRTEEAELRINLVHRDRVYYFAKEMPGRSLGPYCPRCLDIDGKFMVMKEVMDRFRSFGSFECPQCDKFF
jgi:hypothetical protein